MVPLANGTDEDDSESTDGGSGDEASTSAALAIAAAPAHVAALSSGAPQIHPKASNSDRLQSIGEQHATIAAN